MEGKIIWYLILDRLWVLWTSENADQLKCPVQCNINQLKELKSGSKKFGWNLIEVK